MTRYHVPVSHELIAKLDAERLPAGFRFLEQEDPGGPGMHWWLCEDDAADSSLEGLRVEPTITRGRMTEDGPEVNAITERRVLA